MPIIPTGDDPRLERYRYPFAYTVKTPIEQLAALKDLFPDIFKDQKFSVSQQAILEEKVPLPFEADGWFLIPDWRLFGSKYEHAVRKVLTRLLGSSATYPSLRYLGASRQLETWFKEMRQDQDNDLILAPVHLGGLQIESCESGFLGMAENEIGLNLFATAVCLLTHPERFDLEPYPPPYKENEIVTLPLKPTFRIICFADTWGNEYVKSIRLPRYPMFYYPLKNSRKGLSLRRAGMYASYKFGGLSYASIIPVLCSNK